MLVVGRFVGFVDFSSRRVHPRNRRRDEISASRRPDRHAANFLAAIHHALGPCSQESRTQHAAALLPCGRAFPFCRAPSGPPCPARCTCLEVDRQMRLLIERQIQKIASEIPPEWNWAELLSAVESNRDFHRLSPTQQDGARSKVRTWTPIHVEALLREFAFNLSGLKTDAFTELTSNSSERSGFQTIARPTNCRRGCVNYRFAQSTIFLRPRQRHG